MGIACGHAAVVPKVCVPLTAEEHYPPVNSDARSSLYLHDDGASHQTQPTPVVCHLHVDEVPEDDMTPSHHAPQTLSGSLPPDVAQLDFGALLHPPPPTLKTAPPRRSSRTPVVKVEYPMYEVTRAANDAGYALEPFQSSYCLKRTAEVQPDNFRALVEQSHMTTAQEEANQLTAKKEGGAEEAPCGVTNDADDDGVLHGGKSSSNTVAAVVEVRSAAALHRYTSNSSLHSRCGFFSFESMATITVDEVPRCRRVMSYISIYGETGGPRSPATAIRPAQHVPISDAVSFRPSLTASEVSDLPDTASSTVSTVSETRTYGAIMPIGHSQVVDNDGDGTRAWEAMTSRGFSAYGELWPMRQLSRGDLPVPPAKPPAHGKRFVRNACQPQLPPLTAPASPVEPRGRPTPGPQPSFSGAKSTETRSRRFDVQATLGYTALYGRRVPSPSWETLAVLDADYERRKAHRVSRQ